MDGWVIGLVRWETVCDEVVLSAKWHRVLVAVEAILSVVILSSMHVIFLCEDSFDPSDDRPIRV